MIHVMAQYIVKEDKIEEAASIVKDFLKAIKDNEPKTKYDAYHNDKYFLHVMSFPDKHTEEVHRLSPHTKDFVEKMYPLCEEEPKFTWLKKL